MITHCFISTLMRYTVSLEHIPHEDKLTIAIVLPLNTTMNVSLLNSLFHAAEIEINADGSRSFSGCVKDENFKKAFLEEYYLHA